MCRTFVDALRGCFGSTPTSDIWNCIYSFSVVTTTEGRVTFKIPHAFLGLESWIE